MRLFTSASDVIDFCKRCYPSLAEAKRKYGNVGDAPDGRGNCFDYDDPDDHPDYDDTDYRCDKCDKKLTDSNA